MTEDILPQRQAAADLAFLAQHGHLATIQCTGAKWQIDPQGRARD